MQARPAGIFSLALDLNSDSGHADGDASDPAANSEERADVAGEQSEWNEDDGRRNGEDDNGDEDEERDDHNL